MPRIKWLITLILMLFINISFAAGPISIQIKNNTNLYLSSSTVSIENIAPNDARNLESLSLSPQQSAVFSLTRTGYPVRISMTFKGSPSQGGDNGQEVASWDYNEGNNGANACAAFSARGSFSIDCNNNTDPTLPQISLNIGEPGRALALERAITVTVDNGTDHDIQAMQISTDNISLDDVAKLRNIMFDQHQQHTFTLARTGFPARIFIAFIVASTEGPFSGMYAARWEYLEDPAEAYVCHIAVGNDPYVLGCSGDNNVAQPIVDLEITFNKSPTGPRPTPLPSP